MHAILCTQGPFSDKALHPGDGAACISTFLRLCKSRTTREEEEFYQLVLEGFYKLALEGFYFCQPTRLITCANYGNHVQPRDYGFHLPLVMKG